MAAPASELRLNVSGQLHLEAFAMALSRVYTFGPTFRAENSNTTKHLTEFWMLEAETAFASLDDSMALAEDLVKHVLRDAHAHDAARLLAGTGSGTGTVGGSGEGEGAGEGEGPSEASEDVRRALERPYARMTHAECVEVLQRASRSFKFPVHPGMDLQAEHERYLAEEHCGRTPVFVTHYPAAQKAFYMRRTGGDSPAASDADMDMDVAACFDLLVPRVGELIGGSERETDLAALAQRTPEPDTLQWYLDLRRYGSAPHAGWGLGFDRLVQFMTGTPNIRDVAPMPRWPGSTSY